MVFPEGTRCMLVSSRMDDRSPLPSYLNDWRVPYYIDASPLAAASRILSSDMAKTQWVVVVDQADLNIGPEALASLFSGDPSLRLVRLVYYGLVPQTHDWKKLQAAGFAARIGPDASKSTWYRLLHGAPTAKTSSPDKVINLEKFRSTNQAQQRYSYLVVCANEAQGQRLVGRLRAEAQEAFWVHPEEVATQIGRYAFDAVLLLPSAGDSPQGSQVFTGIAVEATERPAAVAIVLLPVLTELLEARWRARGADLVLLERVSAQLLIRATQTQLEQQAESHAPGGSGALPDLDAARLEELRLLSPDRRFVPDLFSSFIAESDDLLHRLHHEIGNCGDNHANARDIAETLGATAASVGCINLSETCKRWRCGLLTGAGSTDITQIDLAYTLARAAMREQIRSFSTPDQPHGQSS